jgi:hypothetical protein
MAWSIHVDVGSHGWGCWWMEWNISPDSNGAALAPPVPAWISSRRDTTHFGHCRHGGLALERQGQLYISNTWGQFLTSCGLRDSLDELHQNLWRWLPGTRCFKMSPGDSTKVKFEAHCSEAWGQTLSPAPAVILAWHSSSGEHEVFGYKPLLAFRRWGQGY